MKEEKQGVLEEEQGFKQFYKKSAKDKDMQQVKIADMDMPFGSMVSFMVKWTIASIPAMIILSIIVAIFWQIFNVGEQAWGIFNS